MVKWREPERAGILSDAGVHIFNMGFPSAAPSERRVQDLLAYTVVLGQEWEPGA